MFHTVNLLLSEEGVKFLGYRFCRWPDNLGPIVKKRCLIAYAKCANADQPAHAQADLCLRILHMHNVLVWTRGALVYLSCSYNKRKRTFLSISFHSPWEACFSIIQQQKLGRPCARAQYFMYFPCHVAECKFLWKMYKGEYKRVWPDFGWADCSGSSPFRNGENCWFTLVILKWTYSTENVPLAPYAKSSDSDRLAKPNLTLWAFLAVQKPFEKMFFFLVVWG